ncbi:MAG: hypothetical protein U0441_14095 [Polyangiaceae bacterium]
MRRAAAISEIGLLTAAILSITTLCACGPSEERASDVSLQAAIARLRDDTSKVKEERRQKLAAVEQTAALTAEGRDAKAACVGAYRKLFDAEEAVEKAERSMKLSDALHNGADPSALTEIVAAEQLLETAREAMPACDAAAAKLAASTGRSPSRRE